MQKEHPEEPSLRFQRQGPQRPKDVMERAENSTAAEGSSSVNKTLYKYVLGLLKILPMLMAGLCLLNTVLSYFGIDYAIISYLGGIGFIPWLFIFLASFLFKFCNYHRMFLYYIVVNDVFCWIDYNYELPISDRDYLIAHITIAGIFLFLILYFRQRCKRKNV